MLDRVTQQVIEKKQDVIVIGAELSRLVPYSLALRGPEYAVTLVEACDVIERARASTGRDRWLILLLKGDETVQACGTLLSVQRLALFVTSAEHEPQRRAFIAADLPVTAEYEGPVPAVATLMAMGRWTETAIEA